MLLHVTCIVWNAVIRELASLWGLPFINTKNANADPPFSLPDIMLYVTKPETCHHPQCYVTN